MWGERAVPIREEASMATQLGALMKHVFRAGCVLAMLASLAACMPKIVAFQANPHQLCLGQRTTLLGRCRARRGSRPCHPWRTRDRWTPRGPVGSHPTTTLFTLTATQHGQEAFAKQEIVVRAGDSELLLLLRTQPASPQTLVASETLSPAEWDDLLRIDTVAGQSGRPLRVVHDGREVILSADGSASDHFRGAKMSGQWDIHAELLPGEILRQSCPCAA